MEVVEPPPATPPGTAGARSRPALRTAALVLAYAAAMLLGRASQLPGMPLAVVWPAAGVGFLWLARSWRSGGPRAVRRDAALVAGTGVAVQLLSGQPPLPALVFAVAGLLQALVACWVHRRLQPAGLRLRQPRDLWALVVAATAGAGAGAALGASAAVVLLHAPPATAHLAWVVRHAASTVVLALVWLRTGDREVPTLAPVASRVEHVVVLTASVAFFVLMGHLDHEPLVFLTVPWAVWLGLRADRRVAVVVTVVDATALVLLTRAGGGPFRSDEPLLRLVDVQLLVLVLSVLTLMLVLHREERHRLELGLRRAHRAAQEQARLLGTVFDTTGDGLSVYDADGRAILRNRAAHRLFPDLPVGLERSRWAEHFELLRPDGTPWPAEDLPVARALRGHGVPGTDVLVRTPAVPDGRLLHVTAQPLPGTPAGDGEDGRDGGGSAGAVVGVRDVTAERAAQARLVASERRFRTAFDTAPVGMMIVGLGEADAARILQVNSTMCAFTGLSAAELLARDFHDLTHPDDRAECIVSFAPFLLGEVTRAEVEKRYERADGTTRWGMLSATVMATSEDGEPHLLCLIEDVTARKAAEEARTAAEEALRHQALHDALTGLPNRVLLRDRLAHALAAAERTRSRVGVVYVDLDGFKAVNDTAGHGAGDELLREVAARFSACLRPGDTLARLGGDEFAVVCPDVGTGTGTGRDVGAVAARLLAAVREPVLLAAGSFTVGASTGTAVADPGTDPETVLGQADAAMYRAKRAGGNRTRAHAGAPDGQRPAVAAR
ncbi:diguanylate cyclase domain-containing protein [Kineococcus aurantiacus]|uniref:Diguanylate cyclase (GGDEF)-like protein/PAS domain S-box-containing protein n=1 Tax=Kineococcus aurantiacus TaxID=37633 RepID=A0A7Y9DNA0_9ACTN|nr:diguanylate cyclase (GGDEF)-like protein/PAS domain S-box-containing protein [Kineococcus aurantiacus]